MIIGCHLSTARGFARAVENAGALGANAFQYFPKNPRSYRIKPVDRQSAAREAQAARQAGVVTVGHSAYVTNLATDDAQLRETTVASIVNELEICEAYGTPWLVVHCGRHMGGGEAAGTRRMVEAIDEVLARYAGTCLLLLENTAGQGSELGRRIDELLAIREGIHQKERVRFCLDTCHAFAAGWMQPGQWERFRNEATRPDFLPLVEVVHLNDSKGGFAEQVDRHALLGQGQMGELLVQFVREPAFQSRPIIIETPVEREEQYADEIRLALRWAAGEAGGAGEAGMGEDAARGTGWDVPPGSSKGRAVRGRARRP